MSLGPKLRERVANLRNWATEFHRPPAGVATDDFILMIDNDADLAEFAKSLVCQKDRLVTRQNVQMWLALFAGVPWLGRYWRDFTKGYGHRFGTMEYMLMQVDVDVVTDHIIQKWKESQ